MFHKNLDITALCFPLQIPQNFYINMVIFPNKLSFLLIDSYYILKKPLDDQKFVADCDEGSPIILIVKPHLLSKVRNKWLS